MRGANKDPVRPSNGFRTAHATSSESLRIEWIPIGAVRPNPRNPRTHSKKQINQIAASIGELGFLNPVIVDGDNTILAGHGRLEGARQVGLTHIPVIRFDHRLQRSAAL
jgi:hypothetical protein